MMQRIWYLEAREDPELETDDIRYGFRVPTISESWKQNPWLSRKDFGHVRAFCAFIQLSSLTLEAITTINILLHRGHLLWIRILTLVLRSLNGSILPLHTCVSACIEMDRLYLC